MKLKIYSDEVLDDKTIPYTKIGAILDSLDTHLYRFMWWRWLMVKVGFQIYCARCGGCGYVECCGKRCDRGIFCARYYEDEDCITPAGRAALERE